MTPRSLGRRATLALAGTFACGAALAHPGHDSTGLMATLAHALFGWHDLLGVLVMTALVAGAGIGLLRAMRSDARADRQPGQKPADHPAASRD
jgi:hydrogenase/urease accessory protein HupE